MDRFAAVAIPVVVRPVRRVQGERRGLLQQGDASGYPLRELKAVADKQTRAQPVATAMERGKVYFLAGAPWLVDFEAELLSFPGEHDDQVDALAYFGLDSLAAAARPFRVRQLSGD